MCKLVRCKQALMKWMVREMRCAWWVGILIASACTKPNPAVCCLDEADCSAVGLAEVRSCSAGLACVDHECVVPSCSMTGCEAGTPVCNITTDVCEGCADSSECSRFTDTDVCDTGTGACVECVGPSDCGGTEPVCDANACRACKLDAECPSGACGDDGACVPESAIVYVDAAGRDANTCTRLAPCRSLAFAVSHTSLARSHIVMRPGGYVGQTSIQPQDTTANPLFIHGGGASLSLAQQEELPVLEVEVAARIRDLSITAVGNGALALMGTEPIVAERIKTKYGYTGISVGANVTLRDFDIEDATIGIAATNGQLVLDRGVIHGGQTQTAISASAAALTISNLLVHGTTQRAMELGNSTGTISFSTVADSGSDSGTGPRAIACGTQITIRSSIIWTPGATSRVPVEGCNVVSTIAGPTTVPGAMNVDPQFVNAAGRDYHISSTSPARDAVDTGPDTDFEGDPRPRGMRFDIGADEAP
jgi:hypothetical protein